MLKENGFQRADPIQLVCSLVTELLAVSSLWAFFCKYGMGILAQWHLLVYRGKRDVFIILTVYSVLRNHVSFQKAC